MRKRLWSEYIILREHRTRRLDAIRTVGHLGEYRECGKAFLLGGGLDYRLGHNRRHLGVADRPRFPLSYQDGSRGYRLIVEADPHISGENMSWQDGLRLFRVGIAVVLGILGTYWQVHQESPAAVWAFTMAGVIIAHLVIWDPIVSWLEKGVEVERLEKTWIETIRTMIGWLFASSSIIIGFIVTAPPRSTQPIVSLISKVGVAVLAAGIFFGIFYTTALIASIQDRNGYVEVKRRILAASTVLLHLTFWGLLGGLIAVVVRFILE